VLIVHAQYKLAYLSDERCNAFILHFFQ